jgi:hypothetical protein
MNEFKTASDFSSGNFANSRETSWASQGKHTFTVLYSLIEYKFVNFQLNRKTNLALNDDEMLRIYIFQELQFLLLFSVSK